ncbi:hypothetical protein E4U43_000975 [Claviceps pusilla]|uniref:Glycine amidinotransferase, mitochondrial n=1 Tax=Claviceps pusilla TaxID=123648 RepID=A0A9P7N8V5_9HYPO|nr:hypothetical protein E4U43_000975 [Claviceps pusilla]
MTANTLPTIAADDEWSPLKAVIVGRAEKSAFPSEPASMMKSTMPAEHVHRFKPGSPFPADILSKAQEELDHLAAILQSQGIRVYRPKPVDWVKEGGYTGAMPRDGLLTVGTTLVEAPFAWGCRRREIDAAYADILDQLETAGSSGRICRAPRIIGRDTIYDHPGNDEANDEASHGGRWAINNSRPAFDAADFMRFGKTIIGQLSHVTNPKGVDYLRAVIPEGYSVEILDTNDEHAMHIDATILPLRRGLLVYHPNRIHEEALRRHDIFRDWELHAYPFTPQPRGPPSPPMFMCTPWLVLNALSLDENRIMVEAKDTQFASWVTDKFGMTPIMCPFQHVNSIGGSFHCATVDLVRSSV